MSEFLSSAWVDDLDAALRASSLAGSRGDGTPFVIEQHVSTVTGDDVCYHLVLDFVDSRARLGAASAPNLVILTDYGTAVGLLRGDTNAQHAIADGRMKIRGDLHEIARRIDALAGLDDLFASVRTDTTIAGPAGRSGS